MKSFYRFYAKLFTLIAILIFSANIYSQGTSDALRLGYSSLSSDARALGMGDSYIGLSDDAGAAFFNPAGYGLLKKMELSGGLSYDNYSNNTTFFGNSSNYSSSATRLNNLSFALPFPTVKGSLVFAVSYHTTHDFTTALKFNGFNNGNNSMIQNLNDAGSYIPYDLYLTDTNFVSPIGGHLNQSGTIVGDGETHSWTFSGAFEAYQHLFLGLNLDFSSGSYNNNNNYYEDDKTGYYAGVQMDPATPESRDFQTFYLNRVLNWDITGWDMKFGMLYELRNARVGLTVQFPKTYSVKEDYTVNGYSQFTSGFSPSLDPSNYSDHVEYDIVTPYELGAGFSYNISSLILSAQATIIDYSQLQFENASGISDADIVKMNQSIKDNLRSVINLNAGAEYTFPDLGIRLRAGFLNQPSPYKGDASTYDRKYVTFGVGYIAEEAFGFDVAYAHGWWDDLGDNYTDQYGNIQSRTYQKVTVDRVILSTTYRF